MSDAKTPLLGRLAVHYKVITEDQLREALVEQGDTARIGEFFVEKGWIQKKQLDRLIQIQRDMLVKHRASQAVQEADPEPEGVHVPPKPIVERPARPPQERRALRATAEPPPLPSADDTFEGKPPPRARTAASRMKLAASPAPQPAVETSRTVPGTAVASPPRPVGAEGKREELHALMRQAAELAASDLHVHAGSPLRMRVHGELQVHGDAPLDPAVAEAMLSDVLDDAQWATLSRHGQVDFAYEVPGLGRFRSNVYRQQRGLDGTFRLVPAEPPTLESLALPDTLAKFTGYHQGMVLVTGPAGCGKSATMAALLSMVNGSREEHIITVEDPIEVIHASKSCLVNQRQVGPHTETFARALRAALREDPDIIGIGELRDLETISLALTAAETGHFVLGTLHTNSAIRTINRLIGVFPPNQQSQIRTMVSESLRAVISQRLVRRADGNGRVPALEVMVVNKAVGNLIRENKTVQIQSILQTGAAQGMGLLDESLSRLVADGTVTKQEALRHCEDPRRFGGKDQ
jgi:twitching motility protein PilT